jgi:hypothetical protein
MAIKRPIEQAPLHQLSVERTTELVAVLLAVWEEVELAVWELEGVCRVVQEAQWKENQGLQ